MRVKLFGPGLVRLGILDPGDVDAVGHDLDLLPGPVDEQRPALRPCDREGGSRESAAGAEIQDGARRGLVVQSVPDRDQRQAVHEVTHDGLGR